MRIVLSMLWCCATLWAVALCMFIQAIPAGSPSPTTHTDAIIVLTGGSLRVPYGLKLLEEGKADALLISGVGKDVSLQELLKEQLDDATRAALLAREASIKLDYRADNTRNNARETARFIRKHDFDSVRLVTANYHMQRSLLELQHALPGVDIIADAVYPEAFRRNLWWRDATTRRLVLAEFHKTYLARLRYAFKVESL
jgi:uncharacterized SAM-binding protein YcdF (DUF218 family)